MYVCVRTCACYKRGFRVNTCVYGLLQHGNIYSLLPLVTLKVQFFFVA